MIKKRECYCEYCKSSLRDVDDYLSCDSLYYNIQCCDLEFDWWNNGVGLIHYDSERFKARLNLKECVYCSCDKKIIANDFESLY